MSVRPSAFMTSVRLPGETERAEQRYGGTGINQFAPGRAGDVPLVMSNRQFGAAGGTGRPGKGWTGRKEARDENTSGHPNFVK